MNHHHFTTHLYQIRCLTPLHAGSGDTNYGEIDKLVQRDATTTLPTIYSSALKGAIKEFCKMTGMTQKESDDIFGKEGKDENETTEGENTSNTQDDAGKNKKQKSEAGKCRFFSADLLCLPIQGLDSPYYLGTSLNTLTDIQDKASALGGNLNWDTKAGGETELNYDVSGKKLIAKILNLDLYLVDKFDSEIAKKLPVIARNHLDNGESKNLWYEEIVPRESYFVFAVSVPTAESSLLETLKKYIDTKTIHIGAHASIGYGYCSISIIE